MTDLDKVKGWIEEYIRLKRIEAHHIEEQFGPGWISDSKYACVDEVEKWLRSNPTEFDNAIEVKACMTPDNFKISDVFPNNCYTEYKYKDGTIKRVCTFKP